MCVCVCVCVWERGTAFVYPFTELYFKCEGHKMWLWITDQTCEICVTFSINRVLCNFNSSDNSASPSQQHCTPVWYSAALQASSLTATIVCETTKMSLYLRSQQDSDITMKSTRVLALSLQNPLRQYESISSLTLMCFEIYPTVPPLCHCLHNACTIQTRAFCFA